MFLAFIMSSLAQIDIWEPSSLRQQFHKKRIEYIVATFGDVPYGHTIYGELQAAEPADACKQLTPINHNKSMGQLIVFAERGGCHFSQKVINAQKIGAGMVIIGDYIDESIEGIILVEKDRQLFSKINIPSILIKKRDGEVLKTVLQGNEQIILAVNFEQIDISEKAQMTFILQADSQKSYDAIIHFEPIYKTLKDHIKLDVGYKI